MRCVFSLVCLLGFLGAAVEVQGGELKSPKGFTVTYPDDWRAASSAEVEATSKVKTVSRPGVEVAALLRGPSHDNITPHVDVFVRPMMPQFAYFTAEQRLQAIQIMISSPQSLPPDAANVKRQRQEFGSAKAVTLTYEYTPPQSATSWKSLQVFIPGKEKIYVFRCTTGTWEWDTAWPIFKKMLDSVHVDVTDAPQDKPAADKATQGGLVGIGVVFVAEEGRVMVQKVIAGSPSGSAGLQPGDELLQIDGQPVSDDLEEVVKGTRGKVDTVVKIKVRKKDGTEVDLAIRRRPISVP